MFLSHHVIITSIVYIISYIFLGNPILAIPFFIGGVLVDLDHCVDYFLRYRKPTFSHKELSMGLAPYKHYIVPLHSYKAFSVLFYISLHYESQFLISLCTGYCLHITLDILFNHYESVRALSLTYRLTHWWNDVCSNTA